MEKIARLLQVDEFHLFDTKGNLYAGSCLVYTSALESRTFDLNTSQIKRVGYHSDYEYQYDRDSVNVVIRGCCQAIGNQLHRIADSYPRTLSSIIYCYYPAHGAQKYKKRRFL